MGRKDWIPARAEPLWHSAGRDCGGWVVLDQETKASLDVQWRIHIEGREPYEFEERNRAAPLWILKGERTGRRWYHPRLRATHGLLREVGVPCRVDPSNPQRIDIDWSRAYDEHQAAWERMDAVAKGVTSRTEGPLGKLLAPVQFAGLRKFSAQEQADIDREIDAEVARQDRATGADATAETVVDVQTLMAESELIQAQQKEAKQIRKRSIRCYATVLEVDGPTGPSSWLYTVRLEVHEPQGGSRVVEHRQGLNYAMVKRLAPGSRQLIHVDSTEPQRIAFEGF